MGGVSPHNLFSLGTLLLNQHNVLQCNFSCTPAFQLEICSLHRRTPSTDPDSTLLPSVSPQSTVFWVTHADLCLYFGRHLLFPCRGSDPTHTLLSNRLTVYLADDKPKNLTADTSIKEQKLTIRFRSVLS